MTSSFFNKIAYLDKSEIKDSLTYFETVLDNSGFGYVPADYGVAANFKSALSKPIL